MLRRSVTLGTTVFIFAACATAGATLGSGVGDAMLSRAPWYAGARSTPVARTTTGVGVLPIHYQTRDGQLEAIDSSGSPDSPMAALLADMNAYLDSLTVANGRSLLRIIAVDATTRGAKASRPTMPGTPPDIRFGCLREGNLPGEDCVARGDSVLGRIANLNQMKLEVGRPSPDWTSWYAEELSSRGVDHALVITLEVGEYLIRQTGLSGQKSVELGSNHVQSLPWMTTLEQPVQVVQLTGALVGRDGKAIRIGAEGIMAKRTRIVASGFGMTALISDAEIEALRQRRREDLAGRPLAWQEALRTLVRELTR